MCLLKAMKKLLQVKVYDPNKVQLASTSIEAAVLHSVQSSLAAMPNVSVFIIENNAKYPLQAKLLKPFLGPTVPQKAEHSVLVHNGMLAVRELRQLWDEKEMDFPPQFHRAVISHLERHGACYMLIVEGRRVIFIPSMLPPESPIDGSIMNKAWPADGPGMYTKGTSSSFAT